MRLRHTLLAASLAASLATAGTAFAADTTVPSPIEQRQLVLDALRSNDVETLAELHDPDEREHKWQNWKRMHEHRHERNGGQPDPALVVADGFWQQLRTPDGARQLALAFGPSLGALGNQWAANASTDVDRFLRIELGTSQIPAEHQEQARELVTAAQGWLSGVDFADAAKHAEVADAVAEFVQATGVKSLHEVEDLPPERVREIAGLAMRAAKRAALVYDIDVDATLDSVRFRILENDGTRAKIRTEAVVLGVPLVFEEEREWAGGAWHDAGDFDRNDADDTHAE